MNLQQTDTLEKNTDRKVEAVSRVLGLNANVSRILVLVLVIIPTLSGVALITKDTKNKISQTPQPKGSGVFFYQ